MVTLPATSSSGSMSPPVSASMGDPPEPAEVEDIPPRPPSPAAPVGSWGETPPNPASPDRRRWVAGDHDEGASSASGSAKWHGRSRWLLFELDEEGIFFTLVGLGTNFVTGQQEMEQMEEARVTAAVVNSHRSSHRTGISSGVQVQDQDDDDLKNVKIGPFPVISQIPFCLSIGTLFG